MNKTIHTLVFPLLALALTSCDDVPGTLKVHTALTIIDQDGKSFTLQPGSHAAAFDLDEDENKPEVEIKVKDARGKKREADLPIPAGMTIPKHSGTFTLTAAQTGQPFDLVGEIQTDEQHSGAMHGTESCTYQVRRYHCWRDGRRGRRCDYVWDTVWGYRDVTYHTVTYSTHGKADFTDANLGTIATFEGSNTRTERYNDYVGICR